MRVGSCFNVGSFISCFQNARASYSTGVYGVDRTYVMCKKKPIRFSPERASGEGLLPTLRQTSLPRGRRVPFGPETLLLDGIEDTFLIPSNTAKPLGNHRRVYGEVTPFRDFAQQNPVPIWGYGFETLLGVVCACDGFPHGTPRPIGNTVKPFGMVAIKNLECHAFFSF
jgi:hypothetical protein